VLIARRELGTVIFWQIFMNDHEDDVHRHRVLFFGDRNHREFADPTAFLEGLFAVVYANGIAAACRRLYAQPVDLIVAAACWPGERTHSEFEALRRAAPFAPILALLSAWCEGEERTGKPWPGALRLYAHQFIPRLIAEVPRDSLDACKHAFHSWSPPLTKTHEDRLLSKGRAKGLGEGIRVAIYAESRSAASALADALGSAGMAFVLLARETQLQLGEFDAIVWDCAAGLGAEAARIRACRMQAPGTPVILLLSFPRCEDYELAKDLGAAVIISKPFLVDDIVCALQRTTRGGQLVLRTDVSHSSGSNQSPRSATSSRTISRLQSGS
jgi:DNA-binding NarL/FixJ family response regulator